jgi:hypothetical protein
MKRSTSHWATAIAAAVLIALPAAGSAQTPASPQTPQNPTAQSSASQPSQTSASTPAEHVKAAKEALSSIQTSTLPASAKPKIAQVRTHLNNLEKEVAKGSTSAPAATASKNARAANWGTEVSSIDKILTDLIGPETGSAASTGSMTSGTAGGATGTAGRTSTTTIDDTTKEKLREVRRHVTELATEMSGTPKTEASAAGTPSPDTMGSPSAPSTSPTSPSPAPSSTTPSSTTPSSAAPTASANQQTTPSSAQPPAGAAQPGQVDRDAAKQHLSEAREALSQLATLPEAAKLQGDTRNQISQLIASFNELITTQADWKSADAKVQATLTALLGPETGAAAAPSPTGTAGAAGAPSAAGTTGASGTLDPAIRSKLEEFRTHMKEFERAAGVAQAQSAQGSPEMSPSVSTGSTSSPATPAPTAANPSTPAAPATPTAEATDPNRPASTATPANPTTPPTGTPGATGTSGTMSPAPTDTASSNMEADKHIDAINDILSKAKDGKLDKEQIDQIKMHLDQLRQSLKK